LIFSTETDVLELFGNLYPIYKKILEKTLNDEEAKFGYIEFNAVISFVSYSRCKLLEKTFVQSIPIKSINLKKSP